MRKIHLLHQQKSQIIEQHLTGDIKGLKIGVPKEYLGEGVSEEAKTAVLEALKST